VGPSLDVPLEQAYAPLKLISSQTYENVELFTHAADHYRSIVLGGPGTGKTTLMKSLLMNIINKKCHPQLDKLIPVFIVLRKLAAKKHTVEDAIAAAFKDHHFPGAEKFVTSALDQGRMIIILDGLDEVSLNREFVASQIREFCQHDEQT
jgi:predicted NACHT family NTPase